MSTVPRLRNSALTSPWLGRIFKHNSIFLKGCKKDNIALCTKKTEVVLCKDPTAMQGRHALYDPWLHFRSKSLTLFVIPWSTEAEHKINLKTAITFIYSTSWTYFVNNYLEDAMEKMTPVYITNKTRKYLKHKLKKHTTFSEKLKNVTEDTEADLNKGKSMICS